MSEFNLDALIEDHLRKKKEERKRGREVGRFWASDFGKCKRQVYYSFTNPKEFSGDKRKIFTIGNLIHEHLQQILKDTEGDVFREVWNEKYITITDTETDLIITGMMDSSITPLKDRPFALELKSENELSFQRRKSVPYHHKCQLMLYLRSQRMSFGYVIYINKSTMELKTFRVEFDEQLFQRLMRDARDIYYCLKHSKLPFNKPKMPWECNYCLWKTDCEKNNNPALHNKLFPNKDVKNADNGGNPKDGS